MKLLLILLAALISASTAAILPEDNRNPLALGNSVDVSVPLLGDLEVACLNRTGSNDTFEQVIATTYMVPLCFAFSLDVDSLVADAQGVAESPDRRVEFFERYCPQVKNSLRCITQVTDLVRKCVEPEVVSLYDTFVALIPESVDLICKNHGEIIFVDGPNFQECSSTLSGSLEQCANNITSIAESMELSRYGEEQCVELENVRRCYRKELADCRVPRMIELFDLFYKPLMKASPCENYTKLEFERID